PRPHGPVRRAGLRPGHGGGRSRPLGDPPPLLRGGPALRRADARGRAGQGVSGYGKEGRSLSLLLALSACRGVPLPPPPAREPPAEIDGVVYTPGVPAAARYNDPAPAAGAATPLEDMVAVAVAAAAVEDKAAIPDRDARLDGAARELAAFLPEDVTPPHDLTSFVLSWFGIVEPYAYVAVASRQDPDSAALAVH